MADQPQQQQNKLNTSDFLLSDQGFVTHYWVSQGEYWKQFLPAGIPFPARYPPHRITLQAYSLALGVYLSTRHL